MADPKTATKAAAPSDYTPSKKETAALQRYSQSRKDRRRFPPLKASTDDKGVANVSSDHPDALVAQALHHDALGIVDPGELTSIINGVFNFTSKGSKPDSATANEALQLIVGLEPRNTIEALLATQMAAIHLAAMDAARRHGCSSPITQHAGKLREHHLPCQGPQQPHQNLCGPDRGDEEAQGWGPAEGHRRAQALLPCARRYRQLSSRPRGRDRGEGYY